jgi:nucleotide-binding universal stress UspA family protein
MYDRLLVSTDGSDASDAAVRQALGLATRFGATVDALAVVDETFPAATEYDLVVEGLESAAEDALTAVTEACGREDVPAEPHLRRGVPHEETLAAADAYGSGLAVMGTHGRTGLDRLRHLGMGSVTERVVRRTTVPVPVTPPAQGSD